MGIIPHQKYSRRGLVQRFSFLNYHILQCFFIFFDILMIQTIEALSLPHLTTLPKIGQKCSLQVGFYNYYGCIITDCFPGLVSRAWVSTGAKCAWHPQNFSTVLSGTRWFWQEHKFWNVSSEKKLESLKMCLLFKMLLLWALPLVVVWPSHGWP